MLSALISQSVQPLSRARLCDPMNRSTPGLPVHHQLPEFTQTHVHQVGDAIQPSHPLSSVSPSISHQFSSVQFSHSVVSDSLQPHELQHARPPCPSLTTGVHSNSCLYWCFFFPIYFTLYNRLQFHPPH